jgi:hypothetical protein
VYLICNILIGIDCLYLNHLGFTGGVVSIMKTNKVYSLHSLMSP